MIYFDNAATTKYKPDVVYDAINFYMHEIGVSPGRGSYALGIEASRLLYKTRCVVGSFFGLSRQDRVLFTKNSTEAINLFFNGYLKRGDHVVITCYEHNAVLRPIHRLVESGIIDYSVISREDLLLSPREIFEKYHKDNTKLFVTTLSSNLTGRIVYDESLTKYFHKQGVTTFLDSSQGAGTLSVDMKEGGIDYLAFTGHKDLLAFPGVGGLCCESDKSFEPLIQGGTGINGELYSNPEVFPERYEAGTLNMPAIWSLHESIEYINNNASNILSKEKLLINYILDGLNTFKNIEIYDRDFRRIPTISFNVNGVSSARIVTALDQNHICVRGGIHCAILAHESLGTVEKGAVRVSLNYLNTTEEIDVLIDILEEIS